MAALLGLAMPLRADILVEDWVRNPDGSPDGAAVGDLTGDGRLETVFVMRGQNGQPGRVVTYSSSGELLWQVETGQQYVGFPTIGDFDGDGMGEVAFCAVSDTGMCRVHDGDGALLYEVGPYYYPGMTNGGPSAADLDGDGIDDMIVPDYGGYLHASQGGTGDVLWTYDLWSAYGDYVFGHAAVGNIDGKGDLEVVVGGAMLGGVYCLNAKTGAEVWARPDIYTLYDNYFHGNGPVLMELDGTDADLEVVAAMPGYPGPAALLALDDDGSDLWRTEIPGETLFYTSPAGADTNGDGKSEVFVQTFSGMLMKFAAEDGAPLGSVDLGADSWSIPSFVNTNFSFDMEIVTSTLSTVFVLDGDLQEIDRYENPGAGLYPSPVLADTDRDGSLNMIAGAWYPAQIVSVPLNYVGSFRWTTLGGSAKHAGSVAPADPVVVLGSDPAPIVNGVYATVVAEIENQRGKTRGQLKKAQKELSKGYRSFYRGDMDKGIEGLEKAIKELKKIKKKPLDSAALQQSLAYAALLMIDQVVARTIQVVGDKASGMKDVLKHQRDAHREFDRGKWDKAAKKASDAGQKIRGALDDDYKGEPCLSTPSDPYHVWLCTLVDVQAELEGLAEQHGDGDLRSADENLRACLSFYPDLRFEDAFPECERAERDMAAVSSVDITALRDAHALAIMRTTRLYLNDIGMFFAEVDPSALSDAEADFAAGEQAYQGGSYGTAIQHFMDAHQQAMPCDDEKKGLEGGGC